MIKLTQTDTEHGNCWQTAVACLLGVPAEALPSQVECERADKSGHYLSALNAYLDRHHGLMYSNLQEFQFPVLTLRDGWMEGYHLLEGPTVRTPQNGMEHVVVGRYGEMVWDPHPSRAGLTKVRRWGILAPVPSELREWREQRRRDDPVGWAQLFCVCPTCKVVSDG